MAAVRSICYLCLVTFLPAAATNTTAPSTTIDSPSGLNKFEILAIIIIPIVGVTSILLAISLLFWCKKKRRQQKSTKYFVDRVLTRKELRSFEEAPYDFSQSEELSYNRMADGDEGSDDDERIREMHGSFSEIDAGIDNVNYQESESKFPNKNAVEAALDELTTSVDVQVFPMEKLSDARPMLPASDASPQELIKDPSVRKEVVVVISNQTMACTSLANQDEAKADGLQVMYSERTAL
ncbi:uncharacterized protein [Watersipora subatra]|uniref:uncharacterized protein n=1 Tax=Watersipora subatra TaxID=2589382 RepID=UPI00355BB4B2